MYSKFTYPYFYQNQMRSSNNLVNNSYVNPNDERFFPFLAPFLLGGVTGALIAPAFYNRPCYNCVYPQPIPYQYNNYYYTQPYYYRTK